MLRNMKFNNSILTNYQNYINVVWLGKAFLGLVSILVMEFGTYVTKSIYTERLKAFGFDWSPNSLVIRFHQDTCNKIEPLVTAEFESSL